MIVGIGGRVGGLRDGAWGLSCGGQEMRLSSPNNRPCVVAPGKAPVHSLVSCARHSREGSVQCAG